MRISVESDNDFSALAICGGNLSSVLPWELRESMIPLSKTPDGVVPATIDLYLEPNLSAITNMKAFNASLRQAGLGDAVLCYVYGNIDANCLSEKILKSIDKHPQLKPYSAQKRLGIFAQGEMAVTVAGGDLLANAYVADPAVGGRKRMTFGVLTTTGLVDPVYFFQQMLPHLAAGASSNLNNFVSLIGTDWPALPIDSAQSAIAAAAQRLYPFPALCAAKECAPLTDSQWREVGDSQKELYKSRLHNRVGSSGSSPEFTFNSDDMANIFQLEAVVEFFMAWPEPAQTTVPALLDMNGPTVDFANCVWNLVFIDPFDHIHLGGPPLPKPAYTLSGHQLSAQGGWHLKGGVSDPPGPVYSADEFKAVLFLVQNGEIKAWRRWSTFTAHKWEDKAQGNKAQASSIKGNVRYDFKSQTATGKGAGAKFINYAFWLWDPTQTPYSSKKCAARYYFRGDVDEDLDGKTGIMIHHGQASNKDKAVDYNASGGCLVSPGFPSFRSLLINLYLDDLARNGQSDSEVSKLKNKGHDACKRIWSGETKFKGVKFSASGWNDKISGDCWVIRPDEATQK